MFFKAANIATNQLLHLNKNDAICKRNGAKTGNSLDVLVIESFNKLGTEK